MRGLLVLIADFSPLSVMKLTYRSHQGGGQPGSRASFVVLLIKFYPHHAVVPRECVLL